MDTVIGAAIGGFVGTWAFVICLYVKDLIIELRNHRKERLEFNLRNEAKFRNDL